ncbi:hypothetical protein [Turneriella parva]|nr:hypothetical protein [Turneriella parva]
MKIQFDAIVLDVTVLGLRWGEPSVFEKFLRDYRFLAKRNAVKIALPQDEYDCSALLDRWLCDWQVNIVYSVLPDHARVLYPQYSQKGKIFPAFTGYISDALLKRKPKPFDSREIDIGYRAKKLPPYFGWIGENKWRIGQLVQDHARRFNLNADIVVGDHGTFHNNEWYEFIENCKFTLGANSGSSILDSTGDLQRQIRAYISVRPEAQYPEIEALFLQDQIGKYSFTALSPRNIEAAILESCQILVEGDYSGVLKPWIHYIPLKADASNFQEVHDFMCQKDRVLKMITDCKTAILNEPQLYYKHHAQRIIADIRSVNNNQNAPARTTIQNSMRVGVAKIQYFLIPVYVRAKARLGQLLRKLTSLLPSSV